MTNVRTSVILAFDTHADRVRTLSVPDASPALDALNVRSAAASLIEADVFDEGAGRLVSLRRAFLESVARTVLFKL